MSLRADLSSLNDSVSILSMYLQEHKQQTAAELAQLQTSLTTTQSSLTTHTQQVNANLNILTTNLSQHQQQTASKLTQIKTSLTTTQSSLTTHTQQVNAKVNILTTNLSQHQQQTASKLAQIKTSLTTTQSSLTTHTQQVNAKLNTLTTNFSQHQQQTASKLAQIKTSLTTTQSSLTTHTQQVNAKLNTLTASLSHHQQQTVAELAQLQTSLQSSLTTHTQQVNAKLNTLTASLSQHQQQTASSLETASSKLDLLTSTTAQLSTGHQQILANISHVECVDTEESSQLHQNLQNNLTHQLEDVTRSFTCGGTGGWRRVVYLDMTDPNTTCPSGWNITGYSKRTCGRASDRLDNCDSVTFPVSGGEYSRVCGRIKAYQWGAFLAFYSSYFGYVTTIDGAYVDGISVTHSNPRQHIWTFVVGMSENDTSRQHLGCPCDFSHNTHAPSYVGEDYFCESGLHEPWHPSRHITLHSNDTLWDGENCLSSSTCCSLHNPPYFVKQLPTPTTDDIEARICLQYRKFLSNVAVEFLELYVQ